MILLIDDDPSFAADLAALLQPHHDFVWANRSDLGLKLIDEKQPERIFLDLDMPHRLAALDEEEGLEVMRRLSPDMRARVVIVTQSLTSALRRELERLGATRFFIKSEAMTQLKAMMGAG